MKRILTLLIITIGFVGLAKAQQTQSVTYGVSKSYTANPAAGTTVDHYVWQLVDASDVSVRDLSTETGATVSITWDLTIGTTYRLKSQVVDDNNCSSAFVYVDVTIAGDASMMFATATDNIEDCSPLLGDTPTPRNFEVVITGGVAPFDITYKLTDKDGVESTLIETFGTAGDPTPLTGILSISDFENTTGANQSISIELISGVTADGSAVTVDSDVTNNNRSVTIYSKPVITNLTLN
ncbi:hypothetical protein [Labilibaculum antarcticum]|uniref:Uncharacterized protein n=1 Tax=Labilibaculum antarcticum TaxID=1717717 RepID=A0A1Y1CJX5_9BACT|nr:hypothetical protein [Labilibaculum antarcticum]BAX80696.1 hypothetical protein ALGA_2369 [Labilibaculum antarcticum]